MKYMLDTNICIYLIKKKPKTVLERFKELNIGDICISSITFAELEYGVAKSQHSTKNKIALTKFLSAIEILPYTGESAADFGKIRAYLEKKGQIIGAYDLMIASHALAENLILVTNNVKEFKRVPNLKIENWV